MSRLAPVSPRAVDSADDRFINRELSWLDFNDRVLDLAFDPDIPLLERVFFCSIVSSNLDEFFMVRVAGLERQVAAGLAPRSADGRTAGAVLDEIRRRVAESYARQASVWHDQLQPQLAAEGVVVSGLDGCGEDELVDLTARFEREIFPVLTPLAVGPGQPFPYISGLSLSLALRAHDPETGEERFARVKVPEGLPRFVRAGDHGRLVPQELVLAHFLPRLFPGMEVTEHAFFRVTRDADFELSDEADDLLEAVELELRRRRFGDVVRVEVSAGLSDDLLGWLEQGLGVTDSQVYPIEGLPDMADLTQLSKMGRPDLKFEPWAPVTRTRFAPTGERTDVFSQIRSGDLSVHLPYDSFATSVEAFVRAAARDPGVAAIKTTVYRTSDDSALMPSLIDAAERSKQTVCLVELKARFDERRNIEWARLMEQAGVHVVHGFANLKIHAKTTLVVRREGDSLRRYVHIGTGNYNAVTARLYEDFGLFTDDEAITADVADLFNHMTGFGRPQRFRKILVAPFNLRSGLIDRIRAVQEAAEAGKPASIRGKVNALTDVAVIEALYRASQAGAEIDIVARSICCLRPGVEGQSERIRVRSVVGRFLEHSRVYWFDVDGEVSVLMGSADVMPRNLDHRIEVVVPVEDRRVRDEIGAVFDTLLADNAQAWALSADGSWVRLRPADGERPRGTHDTLMRRALLRARRSSRAAAV
ncbi:MAG: polyphosphate kinase 1 [Gaiellales bacterium]